MKTRMMREIRRARRKPKLVNDTFTRTERRLFDVKESDGGIGPGSYKPHPSMVCAPRWLRLLVSLLFVWFACLQPPSRLICVHMPVCMHCAGGAVGVTPSVLCLHQFGPHNKSKRTVFGSQTRADGILGFMKSAGMLVGDTPGPAAYSSQHDLFGTGRGSRPAAIQTGQGQKARRDAAGKSRADEMYTVLPQPCAQFFK